MNPRELQYYRSGIFSVPNCKGTMVGYHAMSIVGYTQDYWIIKNSWSSRWGENGFIRFKRGINLCGLADEVRAPIVA
uniref:Peptidase C1A papain C-terminal domain-containing protein n=1 Tax=Panagrolaimus sp. JU765 TaxID=591449 RepID=A0AC34RAK3_9BILA